MTAFCSLPPQIQALYPPFVVANYEIHEWRNASTILNLVHSQQWSELMGVLKAFRLNKSYIVKAGGNKSNIAKFFDVELGKVDWKEILFDTTITVNQTSYDVPTHKVDCFKNKVALEVEWNNKDPFFDRDLNNFRLLFELRTVDVGVIVTRTDDLQTIFNELGRRKSYGQSTTHMSKLLPKIDGGGAGGCPVIVFGISTSLYVDDHPMVTPDDAEEADILEQAGAIDEDEGE